MRKDIMTILILMFVLSGLFLAVLGYGIWSDFKEMNRLECLKVEREARKYGNVNMAPVV